MRRAALLAAALAVLTGAAPDPLAGRVAGKPVTCIDASDLSSGPTILADGRILYERTRRRIWVTRPVGTCPSLTPTATLIVERYGSQLCANDRFRAYEPPAIIPGPICRFGPFTPYDLPARH